MNKEELLKIRRELLNKLDTKQDLKAAIEEAANQLLLLYRNSN